MYNACASHQLKHFNVIHNNVIHPPCSTVDNKLQKKYRNNSVMPRYRFNSNHNPQYRQMTNCQSEFRTHVEGNTNLAVCNPDTGYKQRQLHGMLIQIMFMVHYADYHL